MKKIAFILNGPCKQISGVETAVDGLARGLKEINCSIKIFRLVYSKSNKKTNSTENDLPAVIYEFNGILCGTLSVFRVVLSVLRWKPNIVHSHGLWQINNLAFILTQIIHPAKYLISPHGMLDEWCIKSKPFKKIVAYYLYQKAILKSADLVVCSSALEQNKVAIKLRSTKCCCVHNSIDVKAIVDFSLRNPILKSGKKKLLFISRYHPVKGIEILIAAWNKIRPTEWKLILHGAGETEYVESLAMEIKSRGLVSSVELNGPIYGSDKLRVIQGASVMVLPSYSENFGIVVIESLVAGVPVITTDATPWKDIEKNGCGWIIKPTEDALEKAIRNIIRIEPETLADMGRRGQIFGLKYDLNTVAVEYIRIVHESQKLK
jgi:glycosyltransferase involved in cell wall biosynthesis